MKIYKLLLIILILRSSISSSFAKENTTKSEYKVIDSLLKKILYNKKIKCIVLHQWSAKPNKHLFIDTLAVYSNIREILGNEVWISKGFISENTYMESLKTENNIDSIFNFKCNPKFKSITLINSGNKDKPLAPNSLILTIFNKYWFKGNYYIDVYLNTNFSAYTSEILFKLDKEEHIIQYEIMDISILERNEK